MAEHAKAVEYHFCSGGHIGCGVVGLEVNIGHLVVLQRVLVISQQKLKVRELHDLELDAVITVLNDHTILCHNSVAIFFRTTAPPRLQLIAQAFSLLANNNP